MAIEAKMSLVTNPASLAAIISRETRATPLKSAAISHTWDDATKAKAFFSARVASVDILEGIREQINMAVSGQMSPDQAALWCREFLRSQGDSALESLGFLPVSKALGKGDRTASIAELASSPRLRLIVDQNTRMAESSADWENMMESADILPFIRYHTAGDGEVRDEHSILDGKIWRKDDPELARIYPPNGFNCRCWVEEIDEEEAGVQRVESGAPDGWEEFERDYSYDPSSYTAQTIEAKAKWGGDLTAAYNTESAEYQSARVADLERRRDIMLAAAQSSTDPREAGEALQAAAMFDERINQIKATSAYRDATV
jgi:SPP1 gp7 family putative phage head morphogenesis protein